MKAAIVAASALLASCGTAATTDESAVERYH